MILYDVAEYGLWDLNNLGDDQFFGGDDNDAILSHGGNDTIDSGAGDDEFYVFSRSTAQVTTGEGESYGEILGDATITGGDEADVYSVFSGGAQKHIINCVELTSCNLAAIW